MTTACGSSIVGNIIGGRPNRSRFGSRCKNSLCFPGAKILDLLVFGSKMELQFLLCCLVVLGLQVEAYPGGAPAEACSNLMPRHNNINGQTTESPYELDLSLLRNASGNCYSYQPMMTYNCKPILNICSPNKMLCVFINKNVAVMSCCLFIYSISDLNITKTR